MDISTLRSSLDLKAGLSEVDQIKKMTETIMKQVENRASYKGLEAQRIQRAALDTIAANLAVALQRVNRTGQFIFMQGLHAQLDSIH